MSSPHQVDSITSLLEQARHGNESAKSALFEQYRTYLTYVAQQSLGGELRRRCDAADIVQEAYVAATKGFSRFRGTTEPEFTSWMGEILRNEVTNTRRRHGAQTRDLRREQQLFDTDGSAVIQWFQPVAGGTTPSQHFMRGESAIRLLQAMGTLNDDQRKAIRLRFLDGKKLADIAAEMNRTPDSVVGLVRRGLQALRKQLGPHGPPG